jgi:hypothetical protein
MGSARIVLARARLSITPAHLFALSCLYFCWNCSFFATALTLSGILFQLSTTLTLKKFRLISKRPWRNLRLRGLAALRVALYQTVQIPDDGRSCHGLCPNTGADSPNLDWNLTI